MNQDKYYGIKCGISSFLANYVVGFFHPLQLLKTRFQSHDGRNHSNIVPKYNGIICGLKQIYRSEGIGGLYKGLHFNIFTQAGATALFFYLYEKRKKQYQQKGKSTTQAITLAGLQAGIFATILTQPIWVLKTRILLNIQPGISEIRNMTLKTKEIYYQSGIKGFYKGLSLSLLLSLNGTLQMYAYQGSKYAYVRLGIPETKYLEKNFICGSLSKLMITFITYPLTTIRTRIQQNQYIDSSQQAKYKNIRDITRKIFKNEGYKGFFKGLYANLLRGLPQRGIYFYSYELLKSFLISDSSND